MSELSVRVDPETGRRVADLAHFLGRTRKAIVRDAISAFAELHQRTVSTGIDLSRDRADSVTGSAERERLLAAAGGDPMSLDLRDRVTVRRDELIAALERCGAHAPRLVGRIARGEPTEVVDLLVESDLITGMDPAGAIHEAQRLLGTTVTVQDVTGLRLFAARAARGPRARSDLAVTNAPWRSSSGWRMAPARFAISARPGAGTERISSKRRGARMSDGATARGRRWSRDTLRHRRIRLLRGG